ncbi:hypothetical protein EVA_05928 [gut metagenome]|uniref:Uncharacterized protein n=1 Tax=gut metagenome TaxID=749906 RepID=J9D098_9ZZZZ
MDNGQVKQLVQTFHQRSLVTIRQFLYRYLLISNSQSSII